MINVIVNAADARKATSISAFRISSITEITTFMVIVEGKLKQLEFAALFSAYVLNRKPESCPNRRCHPLLQVTLVHRTKPLLWLLRKLF